MIPNSGLGRTIFEIPKISLDRLLHLSSFDCSIKMKSDYYGIYLCTHHKIIADIYRTLQCRTKGMKFNMSVQPHIPVPITRF